MVAVDFIYDLPFCNIIFEGDALAVIKLVKNNANSAGSFDHFEDDIRRASSCVGSCNWSFVHCEGNGVSHCLARHDLFVVESDCWMEELPRFCCLPSK